MTTETYKQFLIHPNLRCYYNEHPMFVYTEFSTIDEVKARIDRYWSEWEEFEAKRKQGIGKVYNIAMASTDLHDEATQLDNDKWNEKIELHESLKLIEP